MNKQELLSVLQDLDREMSSPCDLVIVGGAAMILHFGANRATQDVDVIILRGAGKSFQDTVRRVADQHGLPPGWLSDAVKGFSDILPPDFYHRLVPLELPFQQLRAYVLGLPEQMAMKIVALREQDLEDIALLQPRLSESDRKVLLAIRDRLDGIRPDWAQKIRYFLQEQGWKNV